MEQGHGGDLASPGECLAGGLVKIGTQWHKNSPESIEAFVHLDSAGKERPGSLVMQGKEIGTALVPYR